MNTVKTDNLKWNEGAVVNKTASVANGIALDFTEADNKLVVLFENTSTKTKATVEAGTGIQATNNIEIDLEGSKTTGVCLESGSFKKMNGENKGKIVVKAPTTVNITVIKLP